MRFEVLLERQERGELRQSEAAEILGMGERSFRRWRDRLRDEGPEGLLDRRLGRPSGRRAGVEEIARMLELYRGSYADFTVKHFHEQLVKRHAYKLGYTVTKVHLHRAGLVRPAPKRSAHRKKRARRPMVGMMLHQDASKYAWLPGDGRFYDLVVTLEDATSAIYSAFLVAEEGTASSLRRLGEVIAREGLFCALYTDRGGHYFHTPVAGGAVDKKRLTQVGRALAQLGSGLGARSCASRRPARSATTIPSNGAGSACRSRRARCGPTSSRRACACTSTRTASSLSSWAPIASPTTTKADGPSSQAGGPRDTLPRARFGPGHAPAQSHNEADNSRAT